MTEDAFTRVVGENSLYSVHGMIHIALADNTLVPVLGDRSNPVTPLFSMDVVHVADPGTREWINRMTTLLTRANHDLRNEQTAHNTLRRWAGGLKQAIYEVAVEEEWCDDYNEFADQWDLIPLERDVDVTITFTIPARSVDDAIDIARKNTTITLEMTRDLRFDAEEA